MRRFLALRFILMLTSVMLLGLATLGSALAQTAAFEPKAKQIYLIEEKTGTVLFARGESDVFPPASLMKLMTAEYVFNAIKAGRITEQTQFKVSEYAWRTGGALSRTSAMFAALNSNIPVIDLLRGMIVQLGNDACIILAEGLEGSEDAFAAKLTERAREIGLKSSVFVNSNGLPNPGNKMTMRELVLLTKHIRQTYPDYFKLYSEVDFEWNKIRQRNRNALIHQNIGIDGMATGFAEGYGYAVVATLERDGTRLILAMGGLTTDKERIEETKRVLEWGLTSFQRQTVFKKGEIVAEAPVFGGDLGYVAVAAESDIDIFVPIDNPDRIRARIVYNWPLSAPVTKGQAIGSLNISVGDRQVRSVAVRAAGDVGEGTLTSKAYDGIKELLFFWL